MPENFLELVTDAKPQKAYRRHHAKSILKSTPSHIIFKLQEIKDKEKHLQRGRKTKHLV